VSHKNEGRHVVVLTLIMISSYTAANLAGEYIESLQYCSLDLTRMRAGMWWFFTLIMISSYTANLAGM
jgi:hypothetical protein